MNKLQIKDNDGISKHDKTNAVPNNASVFVTTITGEAEESVDSKLPKKENNYLEDVFCYLKISGRYHIRFLLLMGLLVVSNAGYPLHYIFSAEDVNYRCNYSDCIDKDLLKLGQNSTLDYKCRKYDLYDRNGTCREKNFDVSSFTDCSEWVYEDPNSFVAEFNLGCNDWKRTLVGTMHSIGFMIGLLFTGPLSDRFGRKKAIIICSIYCGIIGISKSLVKTYWIFIVLETLESLGDSYSIVYTMVVELMTTKNRPVMINLFTISNTTGAIFMTFLAYLTPNWRIFLVSLYSPAFLIILYIFYLDESPRWLMIKGRKAEADQIIRKAAKFNNVVIDEFLIVNMKSVKKSSLNLRGALSITFSSRKLFVRFLLCSCIWFTSLYNTYSLLINAVSLEGNKYINFGLVTLSDVAGGLISSFILTKFRRKGPLITALTLTGVLCVSQSFVPKGYKWLSTLLYVCGKINASITIETTFLYTSELFPTYTRNTMLSLCSSVGRIGGVLAPLTPLLITYWAGLPLFLVGILSLLTASIVTLMPDTSEDVLPDNVKQAEVLGIKVKETGI